jgi:hypothetical protein
MAKKTIEILQARKKDLEQVLTLVKEHHEELGIKQSYSNLQQAAYNLLKKDNALGVIWLIHSDKECLGYALLTFGYSLEFGGKEGTLNEFYIRKQDRKPSVELKALSQIKEECKGLSIGTLHLDYHVNGRDTSELSLKAGFAIRERFRRMTSKL